MICVSSAASASERLRMASASAISSWSVFRDGTTGGGRFSGMTGVYRRSLLTPARRQVYVKPYHYRPGGLDVRGRERVRHRVEGCRLPAARPADGPPPRR